MKKKLTIVVALVIVCLSILAIFAACEQTVTVTFYDGDKVHDTKIITAGTVPEKPTDPTKTGYTFKGWFLTPTSTKEYTFTAAEKVEKDLKLYAQYTSTATDDRAWYIVGESAKGGPLDGNDWGRKSGIVLSTYAMVKKAGTGNQFTITLDLYAGDQFKFTTLIGGTGTATDPYLWDYDNVDTGANVHFGCMTNAGSDFIGEGGIGSAPKNIKVVTEGKYELTLTTDVSDVKMDRVSAVRKGDAPVLEEVVVDGYFIKGDIVTSWQNSDAAEHTMTFADGKYTLEIQLYAKDTIMFIGKVDGQFHNSHVINSAMLDVANSTEHVGKKGNDITTAVDGTYTFVYDVATKALVVTYTEDFDLPPRGIPQTWYAAGEGLGDLKGNNYGKGPGAADVKLTAVEGQKNTFEITLKLQKGDAFQFTSQPDPWANKHGISKLVGNDGANFGGLDNIETLISGEYKFTLTFKDADLQKGEISFERTGDVVEVEAQTVYYLKGNGITGWKDIFDADTKMAVNEGVHTLTVFLKSGEEFMFAAKTVQGPEITGSPSTLKIGQVDLEDAATALLLEGTNNIKTKKAGLFTFTYTEATSKLTATCVDGELPEYDVYVKGSYSGGGWNQTYTTEAKFAQIDATDKYSITITVAVGEEFGVALASRGATSASEDTVKGFYGRGDRAIKYSPADFDITKGNFKALKAGEYTVTFDVYSKTISIDKAGQTYDYYIKGNAYVNNWAHDGADQYKFVKNGEAFELTFTFSVGSQFMMDRCYETTIVTDGSVGRANFGTADGNCNDLFGVSGNPTASQAGTYKLVITVVDGVEVLNIFTVAA